jgi:LacI family transcriptional regulator
MVTGKTGLIGLMVGEQQPLSYGFEIVAPLQQALQPSQRELLIVTNEYRLENERRAVETLLSRRVDGAVIMSGSHVSDARYLEKLSDAGVRTVLINRYTDATCLHKILFDNRRSGFDATERFLVGGHTSVGFIGEGDRSGTRSQIEALLGYREALKAIGRYDSSLEAARDPGVYARVQDHLLHGAEMAAELKSRHPRLGAIVVADDYKALGALRWLRENGYRVPQDVALIGRGGSPEGVTSHPAISTYRTPFDQAAKLAASLLDERQEEAPDTHVLPFDFVGRESCGTQDAT